MVEKAGILWAYLGEGEPPAFPEIDAFVAPDSHTFAFKGHWGCNWLQALEVGIDPSHASCANSRASSSFPIPAGPAKRYAWCGWPRSSALRRSRTARS